MASFEFRTVRPGDVELLQGWHRRPHVLEWWPDPPSRQELSDLSVARDEPRAYIAALDGKPAGFIQCYRPVAGHADGWWLDECDPGARGIDQYLGNPEQLNVGLGARMIREFASLLFEDPAVAKIQVDPSPRNFRAIRCYQKVGFRAAGELVTPDGRALLMYLTRDYLTRDPLTGAGPLATGA